ncbi:MAG: cell division protein, partial [Cyclobacteriaceae bacterium]
MSIKKSILVRVRIAFLLVFLFSAGVLFRIFTIQYAEGSKWKEIAESLGLQVMKVNATRGNIYADDGSLLATSLPVYKVAFDPGLASDDLFYGQIDSLSFLLAKFYGDLTTDQYKRKIVNARKEHRRYMVLNRQEVGYQEKKLMERWPIFRTGRLTGGVIFEKVEKRIRPFSHLGGRTVGSINGDNRGTVGLEYSFNRQLAGRNGEALFQKMAGGGWKPVFDGTEIQPINGYDIQTTINVNL